MSTRKHRGTLHVIVVTLAAAIACGGSSRRTLEEREDAGRGGVAAPGGAGNGGATAGTSAGVASGGAGTSAGVASGGAGTSGGSAGAGGSAAASAGGAGAAGLPSAAYRPPWLPTGAFGVAAQHLVEAATDYTFWLCATSGLPPETCTQAELQHFAPSLEWLACTSRTPGADAMLEALAARFSACAAEERANGGAITACEIAIPDVPGCPAYQDRTCPTGEPFPYRCDGARSNGCPDGYDERNCDPSASQYDCGKGELIEWTAVCDGAPDCPIPIDESRCGGS